MYYKLKYSSLLDLTKNNNIILIKGPLGINYQKIPKNTYFCIDNSQKIIKIRTFNNKKNLSGFLSILKNTFQTVVFGDLVSLNIQGLGLKFLDIISISPKKKYLSMSLGYSDPVNYIIDSTRISFLYKDIRNIWVYSTDYSYLRNEVINLIYLKKPNKFIKRENGISLNRQIF